MYSSRRHDLVITYSDGEGGDAGIGIAAWCPARLGSVPLAGFLEVPLEVRHLWNTQRARASKGAQACNREFNDIMEIEGIAPLLILHNWPWLMKDCLWLHFIDNNSALGSLVKGSASVCQQDIIIGHTWSLAAKQGVLPWFDRVDSKSNPVDGLSRKDFSGSWNWQPISFPAFVLWDLRKAFKW